MTTQTAQATPKKVYILEKKSDVYWYRFEEIDGGRMEIECYWQYELSRRILLPKEEARKMWKQLTASGFTQK